MSSTAVTKD